MRPRVQPLLVVTATLLGGSTLVGMVRHFDTNIQITLATSTAAMVVIAVLRPVATGNRREIHHTTEEVTRTTQAVTRLQDYTEVGKLLSGRSSGSGGNVIHIHRVIVDNEPRMVATYADTEPDTDGVRESLRRARRR